MREQTSNSVTPPAALRERAERLAKVTRVDVASMGAENVQSLVHELQVHQMELDMQNSELQRIQAELAQARDLYQDLYEFAPVGYVTVDRDQVVRQANLVAATMFGIERAKLVGGKLSHFVVSDERDACYLQLQKALDSADSVVCELTFKRSDGTSLSGHVEVVPIPGPEGRSAGCRVTISDITDRKRAEEEAWRQAQAAEAASQAKTQFLTAMSHELRTPMTAIFGMIDLALAEPLSPAARDYLQTAKDSAHHLLRLIDETLDLSRIEAGRFDLYPSRFNLRKAVEQLVKLFGRQAEAKGLAMVCALPDDLPEIVEGDCLRLQQVLMNLVNNAIKFTREGTITIAAEVETRTDEAVGVRFSVFDTGIGVAPQDQARIFLPFTQVDASTTRSYGGTGMGLAISQRLVEIMGGRIWLESQPGQGSAFHFAVTLRVPPPGEIDSAASDWAPQLDAWAIEPLMPPCTRPLTVLLAEDTPANQKLILHVLGSRGHNVVLARNGEEAVSLLQTRAFDALLMDVRMPTMDGFQATAAIRKLPDVRSARVPIIALTAHALEGDKQRCLAAGMDAYLSKPIKAEELVESVERLAAAAPAGPAIFDLQLALKYCLGKYELFQEMIGFFFADAEPMLAKMRAAAEIDDAEALFYVAHRLRNTMVYLGAGVAVDAVRIVEQAGMDHDLSHARDAVEKLTGHVQLLKDALAPHCAPVAQ